MKNETLSIPEILEALYFFGDTSQKEAIEAAIRQKEEITPHLIQILKNLLEDPRPYVADPDRGDHLYAALLLAHFREPAAHPLLVEIFSFPGELIDDLFGDIGLATLPTLLVNTCAGSVESIRALTLNRKADEYYRAGACEALTYAVVEGYVSRESVLEFFASLFTEEEAAGTTDFLGLLGTYAETLCPEEIMDTIQKAYENDWISPRMIRYSDFEEAVELGKEACLEYLGITMKMFGLDDLHAAMAKWPGFWEDPDEPLVSAAFSDRKDPSEKKKKKANKKKRKQAQASRKKNRQ